MGKDGSERKQGGTVMSEDAPVNTGAVVWPGEAWAQLTVRRMQKAQRTQRALLQTVPQRTPLPERQVRMAQRQTRPNPSK